MSKVPEVLAAIDAVNAQDPNEEQFDGKSYPKELLYGQRMTEKLALFEQPSDLLQIAARGQHINRWAIPRSEFPMDRPGYLKWRTNLKMHHGALVGEIMTKCGYSEDDIKYVQDLLMKKNLKKNEEAQTLEDVACLVFLEFHIGAFAEGKTEEQLIPIIQKTWAKMSEKGHELALKIDFPEAVGNLIQKALKG